MNNGADLDIVSHGVEQTRRLGAHLGRLLQRGDTILLEGDFGSGKTTFTQGIAKGMGIDSRYVNSPTFTLINEYEGDNISLHHIDLYRLEGEEQLATLGLEEYFGGEGVTVVEWPSGAAPWLPDDRLMIKFSYVNDTKRTLRFYAFGERYTRLMDDLKQSAYGLQA
ncbi:MAG: tRNA (adenosine(37)-N6)-threonylcarbamoyltransferase complex ATPase subunit type 1 TsaE [Chloroflexia bacterium]